MKHCGTQELCTPRLVLRRMDLDDAEMMFGNWASDARVTRFLRWDPHRNWGETAEILNEWSKQYTRPDFYQWGICDGRTGAMFGSISLFPSDELRTGWHVNVDRLGEPWELGYCIGYKWWDKGFVTEAAQAVCRYWFDTVGALWLTAAHANDNLASAAVLQKNGFVYDHDAAYRRFSGEKVPCRAYRLLKSEQESAGQ